MHHPRSSRRLAALLPLALLCLAASAATAPAQTVITSAPYVISSSGEYILGGNLTNTSNQPTIRISAPNVTLDLNGYYAAGPGNTASTAASTNAVIYVGDVANTVIRNGTVAGHTYGIYFGATTAASSHNYTVENVAVTRCYFFGLEIASLPAPGSVIRNCRFTVIGNSTYFINSPAIAIATRGGFRIENNTVSDITGSGSGGSFGFDVRDTDFVIGNTIRNCQIGVRSGKCLNNLTHNVATPFNYCTQVNGND